MRGLLPVAAAAAALVVVVPAEAELEPVRRDAGEVPLPRVRAGTVPAHLFRTSRRVRAIVRLASPPLAQYGREALAAGPRRRLNVATRSSRAYLTSLARAQQRAVAQLRRAIPEATVQRRYRIVLNALAVQLPASRLPDLVRQPFATRVFGTAQYLQRLNRSPSLISAPAFTRLAGVRGEGMKIAIVDDGVDPQNRFFDPRGYAYPPRFPRGGVRWTTAKVIVARTFPGPGSGRRGRLALDRRASYHGTHVAGIAAGNEQTNVPAGDDHPAVQALSGVAPRAWIGNYRVFTIPTPIGWTANTAEIIAAFEAAVADGMDVVNFSGGGTEIDPAQDPLVEAVANMSRAGVVPVVSAGNERDEFGLGSAGSPGTAPEAISVAAVSNSQVFGPVLRVTAADAPPTLARVPVNASRARLPARWATTERALIDVSSIIGAHGRPVDAQLCGPAGDRNGGPRVLPPRSLAGAIALAHRGVCTFASKAAKVRAAGAAGLILIDNRPGEANRIRVQVAVPAAMISDLDGRRLRAYLAERGGRTTVLVEREPARVETGRGGTITSVSSAGPTPFVRRLKPDLAAPGGQILSATLGLGGGPFAVFDGTSMSAPHVSGAAALLLQRHREWTPREVKSALVATAAPAWADTAQTIEAPVVLGGGGIADVPAANDPLVFTDPVSLSFEDLDLVAGTRTRGLFTRVSDAGGGAGTWTVELHPQSASRGAALEVPVAITIAPGGDVHVPVLATAAGDAEVGDNYGFIVLRRGDARRRIPYFFSVTRPALASVPAVPIRRLQTGDTRTGISRVSHYRFPSAPFGPAPNYFGSPMDQIGAERLYSFLLDEPVVNLGAAVIGARRRSAVDPWLLGSKDENDVQGLAGTPVNVNHLTEHHGVDVGAAGVAMPRPKTYYVAVDSGRDPYTDRSLAGRYVLQSWVNDVLPPRVAIVSRRVSAGRPTIVARVVDVGRSIFDRGSGVDPFSLTLSYRGSLVAASAFDAETGIAVFALPRSAPRLLAGRRSVTVVAADHQEAKNVSSPSEKLLPNTAARRFPLRVVRGPSVTWIAPGHNACLRGTAKLSVVASSTGSVRSVRFFDAGRRVAATRRGDGGVFTASWTVRGVRRGPHVLRAVVTDVYGATATAPRRVRVCR